jgi:nitrite reductase/ring-hydroxylating ferredoxin subunit
MFLMAATHGIFALIQFHALGDINPVVSLLTTSHGWLSASQFPFQILGALALVILFTMAATSHDFWLRTLTAPVWKTLHMLVYLAYALILTHVALGALQSERNALLLILVATGLIWIVGIHLVADWRERGVDSLEARLHVSPADPFVEVCGVDDIPEGRAHVTCLSGERVAVFRYDGLVSALSSVCQHQNGPLGEGRVVRGCVVCPWHGYEYRPDSGCSPAPFTEKVPTFAVQVRRGRVFVDARPFPAGTRVEPARIHAAHASVG